MPQGSFDHLIYTDYLQEKLNIFSDDPLDSELLSIVVALVSIPALVDHIFFNASPLISFEDAIGDMPAFRLVTSWKRERVAGLG